MYKWQTIAETGLYMCAYVCIRVYMHMCVYMYVYVCMYMYVCICMYKWQMIVETGPSLLTYTAAHRTQH